MPKTTTDEFRRDRHGFPIDTCNRCGGSGRYSWNAVHADMCYGCQGSGLRHLVPKHHAAWRDAVRAAVRVVAQDLEPGDRVRPWGDRDPGAERTVARVYVTGQPCAWSHQPTEAVTGYWTELWLLGPEPAPGACRWADDECFGAVHGGLCQRHADEDPAEYVRVGGTTLYHRLGVSVDPAPYVARAERGARYLRARGR